MLNQPNLRQIGAPWRSMPVDRTRFVEAGPCVGDRERRRQSLFGPRWPLDSRGKNFLEAASGWVLWGGHG